MQYFHVMNRLLAKNVNKYYQEPRWSQMYAGSMIGGRKVHGLMLSSTVAIYNSSADPNKQRKRTLLGVGGTDVPLEQLQQFIKPHQLGPNGYAFLMTQQGYVTIHPKLKLYYRDSLRKNYRSMSIYRLEGIQRSKIK